MTKLSDLRNVKFSFVVVAYIGWRRYRMNAIIEPQQVCYSLEEARRVKASFENADNERYIILRKEDIFREKKESEFEKYLSNLEKGRIK